MLTGHMSVMHFQMPPPPGSSDITSYSAFTAAVASHEIWSLEGWFSADYLSDFEAGGTGAVAVVSVPCQSCSIYLWMTTVCHRGRTFKLHTAQAYHRHILPMLSELKFISDNGHTSPFNLNDDFGSDSSYVSARV